jgi:glucokinase
MSLIARAEDGWFPLPSEGGHQSFAPRTDDEIGLLRFLRARFGHVSAERVVSGPGIHHIYQYLLERGIAPEVPEVAARLQREDPAAVISQAAQAGHCLLCARALDMFLEAYGAVAGSLALIGLATGGVYIGGGIAPKLWPKIADGTFLHGFRDKGRLRPLLENTPVYLIRNPLAALHGAARRAMRLQDDGT